MDYRYQDPRPMGYAVCALAGLQGLLNVAQVGYELRMAGLREDMLQLADTVSDQQPRIEQIAAHVKQLDLSHGVLVLLEFALFVVNIVLFCLWLHRTACNTRALGAKGHDYSPGWTVGWLFIPFANLVMTYRVVREIWQSSENPLDWSIAKTPVAVLLWWITNLASGLMQRMSMMTRDGDVDLAALLTSSHLETAANLTTIVSTACFVYFIHTIGAWQSRHWMQAQSATGDREPLEAMPA